MAAWELTPVVFEWVSYLVWMLDARIRPRIAPLLVGALFAQGRRTVSRWIVAAGLSDEFKRYYYALGSLGRKSNNVASCLAGLIRRVVPLPERILLAIDDTLTKRYGPHVEGAGIHHNPTPGPAGAKLAYGHVWVTLAWLVRHPRWGTIALPLLAKLYVRVKDIGSLVLYDWPFRTKLELAGALLKWAVRWLSWCERPVWVVVDGGYSKRPFLDRARELGVTVVGRLRKDAALCDVPPPRKPGQRGRTRKYGKKISLAGRARHRLGWQTGQFTLYGQPVTKTYKTFLATSRFVRGHVIRVVIVKETHGWFAWFCTDPDASVADILEAVADRAAIEQVFHDVKEVHGAGQQQLRHVFANVGAWHLLLWLYALIELWAWDRDESELADRTARPWDDKPRRPSHADKAGALRRTCLRETFSARAATHRLSRKIERLVNQLASLVG